MKKKKIVTHKNPDLDAIGLVFLARRKFGEILPVVLTDVAEEEDLRDPSILVGDVGSKAHKELGHRPDLNNFDHHFGVAERSATFLFNLAHPDHSLAELVKYIDKIDTGKSEEDDKANSLKVAIVGVRVKHKDHDDKILEMGCKILDWTASEHIDPGNIPPPCPSWVNEYLKEGKEELKRIGTELKQCTTRRSCKGRTIGYLISASQVASIVKEEVFKAGIDIAVVHWPQRKRYSLGCCLQTASDVDLEREIAPVLTDLEKERGMSQGKWGGHPDRIGSPRAGSLLSPEEVIRALQERL